MDDLVKQAREALDGVTPGPWATYEHINGGYYISSQIDKYTDEDVGGNFTPADARLIAASRALVPAMADRIERDAAVIAAADALAASLPFLVDDRVAHALAAYNAAKDQALAGMTATGERTDG